MYLAPRKFSMALFVAIFVSAFSQHAVAQNLGSTVTINLDLAHFGLDQLTPAPTQTGSDGVFAMGWLHTMPIILRQWSDGSVSVETSSRYQTVNQTTGSMDQSTIGGSLTFKLKVDGVEGGSQLTVQETSGTSFSSSLSIVNSISYTMEGNLLKAHVTWTENGVTRQQTIDLGTVAPDGSFRALPGKEDIISGYSNFGTVAEHQPGRYNGVRGRADSGGTPVYAQMLVGYWMTVATVGGRIVSVSLDPQYATRLVGFTPYTSSYSAPGGTQLAY